MIHAPSTGRTMVHVGPKQTVFNSFPRRHSEPSPSECGRYGGPSHTTQKPSGICPLGTHTRQNEVVCDRRATKYGYMYSSVKRYNYTGEIVSGRKYIPHSQSPLNVSVRIYVPHSHSKENVSASWRNANSFQENFMYDCSLIQHGLFLETLFVAWGYRPRCFLINHLQ